MVHYLGHYESGSSAVYLMAVEARLSTVNVLSVDDVVERQNAFNADHLFSCDAHNLFTTSRVSNLVEMSEGTCNSSTCYFVDREMRYEELLPDTLVVQYVDDPLVVLHNAYLALVQKKQLWMSVDEQDDFFTKCSQFRDAPLIRWHDLTDEQVTEDLVSTLDFLDITTFGPQARSKAHVATRSGSRYEMRHVGRMEVPEDPMIRGLLLKEGPRSNVTEDIKRIVGRTPSLCSRVAKLQQEYDFEPVACSTPYQYDVVTMASVVLTVLLAVLLVRRRSATGDEEKKPFYNNA